MKQSLSKEHASNLFLYQADVSDENSLQKVSSQITKDNGTPTIWINNAGIATIGSFEQITSEQFDKVIDVNLKGVIYGTRIALNLMRNPERGRIVNVASIGGSIPAPFMSSYVATKHAVVGFTKSLQNEKLHQHSAVDVLLVQPGFVKTDMIQPQNGYQLPNWMDHILSDPEKTAQEIIKGVEAKQSEIHTSLNGKLLMKLHRINPKIAAKSAKILVAKNWKELIGLTAIDKED